MSDGKRTEVLFEHTWKRDYGPLAGELAYTFRIVGAYWEQDGGRVGALYCEQLTTDAMGVTSWQPTDDFETHAVALGRLLQLAGKLPADDDLSELP